MYLGQVSKWMAMLENACQALPLLGLWKLLKNIRKLSIGLARILRLIHIRKTNRKNLPCTHQARENYKNAKQKKC